MQEEKIYETENFIVCAPKKPHIPRLDGGHIVISGKKYYNSRLDFSQKEAKEAMRLTMLMGEAMIKGLERNGIHIGRINYEECGNWAFLRGEKPFFHIHLYGRTIDAKSQKWGQALYFPDPSTDFYDNFEGLNDSDIAYILEEVHKLENTAKYNLNNWQ